MFYPIILSIIIILTTSILNSKLSFLTTQIELNKEKVDIKSLIIQENFIEEAIQFYCLKNTKECLSTKKVYFTLDKIKDFSPKYYDLKLANIAYKDMYIDNETNNIYITHDINNSNYKTHYLKQNLICDKDICTSKWKFSNLLISKMKNEKIKSNKLDKIKLI